MYGLTRKGCLTMENSNLKLDIKKKLDDRGVFVMEGLGRGTSSDVLAAIDLMDKLDGERDEAMELDYIRKAKHERSKRSGKGVQG